MTEPVQAAPVNVSSGEPDGQWKQAVTWFQPFLLIPPFGLMLQIVENDLGSHPIAIIGLGILFCVTFYALLVRMRLAKQRLDVLIDGRPVRIDVYTDTSRRTWLAWESARRHGRSRIGDAYFRGWVDHEIALAGKRYRLRILIKPYGEGCVISNSDHGFDLAVLRNTFLM